MALPTKNPSKLTDHYHRFESDMALAQHFYNNLSLFADRLSDSAKPSELSSLCSDMHKYFSITKRYKNDQTMYNALKFSTDLIRCYMELLKQKIGGYDIEPALKKTFKGDADEGHSDAYPLLPSSDNLSGSKISGSLLGTEYPCKDHSRDHSVEIIPPNKVASAQCQSKNLEGMVTPRWLRRYAEHSKIVGEIPTYMLMMPGLINEQYIIIQSLSGSGKSHVANPFMDLIDDAVYRIELGSKTSEFYSADEINKHKVIYYPEVQKALKNNHDMVEFLKNLSEGRPAKRIVRDQHNDRILTFEVTEGKSILCILAVENDFKIDSELSRRFLRLYTDISVEQTKKIMDFIGEEYTGSDDLTSMKKGEIKTLRGHILSCMGLHEMKYVNPFAPTIVKEMPPSVKTRSYVSHYLKLINGYGQFNHLNRIVDGSDLFVEMQDAYLVHTLYADQFVQSVLDMPLLGQMVLDQFNGDKELTSKEIFKRLNLRNVSLTATLIKNTITKLADIGFLESAGGTDNGSYRKLERKEYDFLNAVDWERCWIAGVSHMQKHHPDIAEEWVRKQVSDDGIKVWDPIQDKDVMIVPAKSIDEVMDDS